MGWLLEAMESVGAFLSENAEGLFSWFTAVVRLVLPLLAGVVVFRSARSLLGEEPDGEEWGYLSLPNGARLPLRHWENVIGRAKSSDICLSYPTVSRSHAALIRDDTGAWRVYDLGSKGGVFLGGEKVDGSAEVKTGDVLRLGGVDMVFVAHGEAEQARQALERARPGRHVRPAVTLMYLTAFQVALGLQLCIAQDRGLNPAVPACFLALVAMTWLCYVVTRLLRRVAFEVETLAFFLSTIGMAVTASAAPGDIYRQTAILLAGVCLYFLVGWFLRDLDRAVRLRWPIAAAGLALLLSTLLLGKSAFGAKNWLEVGGVSFQPSELAKVAFVFAGASTLDRLYARRNLWLFIAFSAFCVAILAGTGDFGTALVFFAAYLTIAFIRSGDIATVFLSLAGAGLAGFIAATVRPHVAERFAVWGRAWEMANALGYQQTRTMSAAASGGLFGLGAGNGWLKSIFAASTDMVFGVVSEEIGLLIASAAIFSLLILAVYAVRASRSARSAFYVIGACASAAILVVQMLLNVFGSVDILPFTGITFPFVSKGGSSLIACWGLLAFLKAVDTRQNASFAVRLPKRLKSKKRAGEAGKGGTSRGWAGP